MSTHLIVAALVAGGFVPSVLYAGWLWRSERTNREPWPALVRAFLWGATGGAVLGVILSLMLAGTLPGVATTTAFGAALVLAVVVAPLAEEFSKALGLRWVKDPHPELEDGLIYGAVVGLGFAATENVLYGAVSYWEDGLGLGLGVLVARTFSSSLLHATTSAVLGYGIWKVRAGQGTTGTVVAAYAVAVLLHAGYNLAATIGEAILGPGDVLLAVILVLLPFVIAGVGFRWVRRRIVHHDTRSSAAAGSVPGTGGDPPTFTRLDQRR